MSANFNKVIIAGNITRDPEMRYTPKGTAVCKITLAVNRRWNNEAGEKKEEVTFVDVDAFGKVAEIIGQYLKKGSSALIEGRLKLDQWQDKTTGKDRSRLGVVCEQVQFLGAKVEATTAPASRPTQPSLPASEPDQPPQEGDDVPF